jgi:hypothetical protein
MVGQRCDARKEAMSDDTHGKIMSRKPNLKASEALAFEDQRVISARPTSANWFIDQIDAIGFQQLVEHSIYLNWFRLI